MKNIIKTLFIIMLIIWEMFFFSLLIIGGVMYIVPSLVFMALPFVIIFLRQKKMKTQSINVEIVEDSLAKNNPNLNDSNAQYIIDGNCISKADNSRIEDDEIPYLIELGHRNVLEREKASSNPKFHRTEREGELSFNFSMRYADQIERLESDFMDTFGEARKTFDLQHQLEKTEEALVKFHKAKEYCYKKSKGGELYFKDAWEYMDNSNNECFSYEDLIKEDITQLIIERDIIIPSLLTEIEMKKGELLQKNIYNLIPDISRSELQRCIKKLEKSGRILERKKALLTSFQLTPMPRANNYKNRRIL